jgi:hypothetical protein
MASDIPELQVPDYHAKELDRLRRELFELEKLSDADLLADEMNAIDGEVDRNTRILNDNKKLRKQYGDMLKQVKSWNPPTIEHDNLKQFMITQIEDSIKWDCNESYYDSKTYATPSVSEIRHSRWVRINKDILYHMDEYRKEVERTDKKNKWIKQLKDSLPS